MDDFERHALSLGKLVGNLLSLELLLRAAIATLDREESFIWPFEGLTVGDTIKADPITNFESLGPTIDKFNALVPSGDRLDRDGLVGLRDALAHGRIGSRLPAFPLRLVKFGGEQGGRVPVEAIIDMTDDWFRGQVEFTRKAIETVARQLPSLTRRE